MVDFVDAAGEGEKDRHHLNWMQYISLSFLWLTTTLAFLVSDLFFKLAIALIYVCVCVLFVHRRCKSLSPLTVICRKEMSTQNAFKNINHLNYLLPSAHRVQN
jgi:hypothetical protein